MIDRATRPLDLLELQRILLDVDPGALLVPPRVLRRIIKRDRRLPGFGLQVPHRKTYVIRRDALLQLVERADLQLLLPCDLPETVILLARPDAERLAAQPAGAVLVKYWRLLFHARVHQALDRLQGEGKLSDPEVARRCERLGGAEFEEIRAVLRQDKYLLPPHDDRSVYVEFAALYLELRYFAGPLIRHYFPAIADFEAVDALVAEDVDGAQLFAATRPRGAGDLPLPGENDGRQAATASAEALAERGQPHLARHARLLGRAARAAAGGNIVRAAILRQRALRVSPPQELRNTWNGARAAIEQLAARLQAALELTSKQTDAWRKALPPLLAGAARGIWPPEARLLYDLQKACIDHEREIYSLDVVDWMLSLGRRPVKRLLPNHQSVLMTRHLRKAVGRLASLRLAVDDRRQLASLLHHAVDRSEEQLRHRLRPVVAAALDRVDLRPHNFPERIARAKLVEELLDLVVERGFFTMADLRDAVSRNNVKLPDLNGPGEFFFGDRLIRTNRRFGIVLAGVYHRGEIYLRWLQRLSSLAFGTRPGRFLVRYLVLPFGASYVALAGLQHMIHIVTGIELHLAGLEGVLPLGFFLVGLLHVPVFRTAVLNVLGLVGRGLRALVIDWPVLLVSLPWVQWFLHSRPFTLLRDFVLKPAAITGPLALFFPLYDIHGRTFWLGSAILFLTVNVFLHSRLGRHVEEAVVDSLQRLWLRFRLDIFPALFTFTMNLFKGLVAGIERLLYTVDEWLRFRTGQHPAVLVAKAALGFCWFFITYLIRVYVNLLIEPTFNPIKHFPVVTVAAKLMLPLFPLLLHVFAAPFLPLGKVAANTIGTINFFLLPGVFGFLVWELKSNWLLYEANRPLHLRPVVIGHHGETLVRLLRPGFHSGTVPKLFARLRRAERRALREGDWRTGDRYREALHHVQVRLAHFVEREFLPLLNGSRGWGWGAVALDQVQVGTNRCLFSFGCEDLGSRFAVIAFEERPSGLMGRLLYCGIGENSKRGQSIVWSNALAGLFQLSGVDLAQQQAAGELTAPARFTWLHWVHLWRAEEEQKPGPKDDAKGASEKVSASPLPASGSALAPGTS
jgi:hypothetical protein